MANFKSVEDKYSIDKKSAAAFLMMLNDLEVGDAFKTTVGTIHKSTEDTFSFAIDDECIEQLLGIWAEETVSVRSKLFANR